MMEESSAQDDRLGRLFTFANDVLEVCKALAIEPIRDGSLALRAYTQDSTITVHDIDFTCSEADFPRLRRALESNGICCEVREWGVLQARRDDLKVEFGATEVWMQGIAGPHGTLRLGNFSVRVVNREALRKLYQRGFDATSGVASQRVKHEETAAKLCALNSAPHEDRWVGALRYTGT